MAGGSSRIDRTPVLTVNKQLLIRQPDIQNARVAPASDIAEDQRLSQSTKIGKSYLSHNPFISPIPSRTPSIGGESDSTSGLDEFHLERYSQGLDQAENIPKLGVKGTGNQASGRAQEELRDRRLRPGLNIITHFPARSLTDGTIIERVNANHPRLGHRSITSIKSQKVEHGFEGARAPQATGFVSLKDLAGLRRANEKHALDAKKLELPRNASISSQQFGCTASAPTRDISPADRSIVIGIEVPKDEVEAHQPKAGDSALSLQTPGTPTIVITPANERTLWSSSLHPRQEIFIRRPVSSVYSQIMTRDGVQVIDQAIPPGPQLRNPDGFILDGDEGDVMSSMFHHASGNVNLRDSIGSYETIFDEDKNSTTWSRPKSASGESQMQILQSSESARPKSKGWWNLMLSPMLARAGTKISRKSPGAPTIPELPPSCGNVSKRAAGSSASETPLTTPRRLGMGNDRVSTWSKWTEWENDRDKVEATGDSTIAPIYSHADGHKRQLSTVTVACALGLTRCEGGLAAEYFQACAIDQRGREPYFECQNHSCAENLPRLGFFPPEMAQETPDDHGDHFQHLRSESNSTIIDDGPTEFSPNVHRANVAPITKAKALNRAVDLGPSEDQLYSNLKSLTTPSGEPPRTKRSTTPPAYSPPRNIAGLPTLASVMALRREYPLISPGPISPETQRAMAPRGAVPLDSVRSLEPSAPAFVTHNTTYPDLPPRQNTIPVTWADIGRSSNPQEKLQDRRRPYVKNEAVARKAGSLRQGRASVTRNGCFGKDGLEGRKRRRWRLGIGTILLLVVITCVALATQLTRRGDRTPIQSQWLNLTGYPPIPTGISTIAKPDVANVDTSCVQPPTLWSCSVPKEDLPSTTANKPDSPNLRLEIRFRNGTVPNNGTIPLAGNFKRSNGRPKQDLFPRQNDPFTNALYSPAPPAPALQEQVFLGQTTDGITLPFEGEQTPFFVTFISATPIVPPAFNDTSISTKTRRSTTISPPSIIGSIPAPDIAPDGTAAAANLLPNNPLPFSQPLRLFNRGQTTEHYGFYTYYDRAIFLQTLHSFNDSNFLQGVDTSPDDQNGGCPKPQANLRCTWSQTRFLFKIWTNPSFGANLISSGSASLSSDTTADGLDANSATEFNPPGSFPYPVSIVLDRHGGALDKKGLYCYGMDDASRIIDNEKVVVNEIRGSGGVLVNPAPPLIQVQGEDDGFNKSAGGIDGGTGGCGCEWRNWISVS